MTISEHYQIDTVANETTSLLAVAPISVTIPTLSAPPAVPAGATAAYSPVVGPGGSTGGSWPFGDYNVMNSPEGNMAALPPLFWNGSGGQGGDPFALAPGADDNAMAGYANTGAGYTGLQACQAAQGSALYQAVGTQLNDNNAPAACTIGLNQLAQVSTEINWGALTVNGVAANVDIKKGATEILQSQGAICGYATAGAAAAIYTAAREFAQGNLGAGTFFGIAAGAASLWALGSCAQVSYSQGQDPNEVAFLGTVYRAIYGDLTESKAPPLLGSQAVSAGVGGIARVDGTRGGTIDYLHLTSASGNGLGGLHGLNG